jgi:hypothetical protein
VKTRKFFALKNDYVAPGARKQRCCGAASRTAADYRDVVDVGFHPRFKLAKLSKKENLIEREVRPSEGRRQLPDEACALAGESVLICVHLWLSLFSSPADL